MATSIGLVRLRLVLSSRRNCGLLLRSGRFPAVSFARSSSDEESAPKLLESEVEDVERIRNVSRMPEHLWKMMKGEILPPDELLQRQPEWVTRRNHKKILRKQFGKFGKASGLNPGMLWPATEELKELINTEKKLYPSLQEMVANVQKKIKEQEDEYKQREEEVVANYAKLQTWIKDLEARQQKKLAEAQAQKEKKAKLIEEVRAYFGYRVDPKDERFKELLEKKEKEEKKALKEARKKEKIAKEWEKITKLAEEAAAAHAAASKIESKNDVGVPSVSVTYEKSSDKTEKK